MGSTGLFTPQEKTIERGEYEIEVGYWISRDSWGKGYATETVKRMLEYAFETLKMEKVWCGAFVGNIRSIRVQEKCLFVYSHEEEVYVSPLDEYRTERFSYIVKDDWMNRK